MDTTNFSEVFDSLLKVSPPIALAIFINFLLLFIGKLEYFRAKKDWLPIIALLIGGLVYPLVAEVGKISFSVPYPTMLNIVIGVCIGGLSVAFHQIFKNLLKKVGASTGDTMIITKDETK